MGQPRIYIYVVMLPLHHLFSSRYLPLYPVKVVPNRPAQTESGIQSFKKSFQLPDNSTTNSYSLIPNKEEWSCRRRAIPNKQFNKTLHHSRTSTEQLERSTMIQHLLQAFLPKQHLMAVWLSRAIIVLYHRFCHIKDVRRKIVI